MSDNPRLPNPISHNRELDLLFSALKREAKTYRALCNDYTFYWETNLETLPDSLLNDTQYNHARTEATLQRLAEVLKEIRPLLALKQCDPY
jgi:hypothetical protein